MARAGAKETNDLETTREPLSINLLVKQYHHFLALVWPFVVSIQEVAYILRWESPQTTVLVWFILLLMCFSVGKYCLLLLSLASVAGVATIGWLRRMNHTLVREHCKPGLTSPTHPSKVYDEAVLDYSTKYKIAEERKKRVLLDCRQMIGDLLTFLDQASESLETFYDLLCWRESGLSAIFYISLSVALLSAFLFPVSLCLCVEVCLVFGVNPGFLRLLQRFSTTDAVIAVTEGGGQGCTDEAILPSAPSNPEILVDPYQDHFAPLKKTDSSQMIETSTESTEDSQETTVSEENPLEDSGEGSNRSVPENGECSACQASFKTFSNKRRYCRNCGNHFCSRCCSKKLPRSALGATSPAARREKELVCSNCWLSLREQTQEQLNGVS